MTVEHAHSSFLVDVFGAFRPEDLRIVWRDEPRLPHAELDRLIADTWRQSLENAQRDNVVLFNGELTRCLRHHVDGERLTIEVGPTDYAAFMGTNFLNHHRGDEFGWELFSNPIGTTATLVTADGWLLYGRRNQRVACHPGYIHTFGGGLEARERLDDGTFDAFGSTLRELKEELDIDPVEVTDMICVGLIRDATIRQPELIFDAYLQQSRHEIEQRLRHGDPDEEHEEIVALRDTPDAAVPFIRGAHKIAPVAVGAICQHGRRVFGEDWCRQTLADLAGLRF